MGRDLLPVAVIPITSVVTEMAWASDDFAEVRFLDGRVQRVELEQLGDYVTETNNPQNVKRVSGVSLHLPDLARYQGLRFVDTPGLESAFVHNTGTSLGWAPISICLGGRGSRSTAHTTRHHSHSQALRVHAESSCAFDEGAIF